MSLVALVITWIGVYKILENINKVLIALMILAFVLTAFFSGPDLGDLVTVGFSFQTLGGEYWLVLALLATTMHQILSLVCPLSQNPNIRMQITSLLSVN